MNRSNDARVRTVRCPTCGDASRYAPDNAFRPFCSERCRHLDLGAWAQERYRVEADKPDEGEDGELQTPAH